MRTPLRLLTLTDERSSVDFFAALGTVGIKQAQAIAGDPLDPRPFNLFNGSRAAGKTFALTAAALLYALQNPGFPGAVLSRTLVDADDVLIPQWESHLAAFEQYTGINLVKSVDKGTKTWTLINGAIVKFRPYDRIAKVRGKSFAWMCIDEIEHGQTRAMTVWTTALFCLRGYKHAPRKAIFVATTPNGLQGVIQHFFEAQQADSPRHVITHSTLKDAVAGGWVTQEEFEAFKAGSSKRAWKEEGLGMVLRPRHTVYEEYDEEIHLIDWQWDRRLPYIVLVDWGEAKAVALKVQYVPADWEGYETLDGLELPPGTWVVADELVQEQTTRPKFWAALCDFVDSTGYAPDLFAADRAVKSENRKLVARYETLKCDVITARTKGHGSEQDVATGIAAVQYMLEPNDGPPRLYVSSRLTEPTVQEGGGIRKGLTFYGYVVDAKTELPTDRPDKRGGNDDPCDALRYGVRLTARRPEFHGGQELPYFNPAAANLRGLQEVGRGGLSSF